MDLMEQITCTSTYYALSITGTALAVAVRTGNKLASYIEPYAIQLPILEQEHAEKSKEYRPHELFEIRNRIAQIAAMGIYSIPFTPRLFDIYTATRKTRVAAKQEDMQQFHVYSSGACSENIAFSFSGSSWLFFYHLGVGLALQHSVKSTILSNSSFIGTSTSSVVAALLALDIPLEILKESLIDAICKIAKQLFGPISQMSRFWESQLEALIPLDISKIKAKKLYIALSKFPKMSSHIESTFDSKQDLINHILASCYMPVLFEKPIKIKNALYVNGAFTSQIPTLKDSITVTCSPHAGEANICPQLLRYTSIQEAFPPHDRNVCLNMIDDGYKDAIRWLSQMYTSRSLPEKFFQPNFKNQDQLLSNNILI